VVTTARDIALPTYRVTIAAGALGRAADVIHDVARAHRYAIISDANVGPLYAAPLRATLGESRTEVLTIPAGEAHKTRGSWASLTDELLTRGFGRDSTIIALGGGVVGDLAGFVAATFMRGVPFVQIPTSLLAMIDASVGGKTGVDTAAGKEFGWRVSPARRGDRGHERSRNAAARSPPRRNGRGDQAWRDRKRSVFRVGDRRSQKPGECRCRRRRHA
jgi:hypothetical protein